MGLAAVSEAEEEEAGLVVGQPKGQGLSLTGAGSGHSFVSRLGSLSDLSPKIAQLLWRSNSSGSGVWWCSRAAALQLLCVRGGWRPQPGLKIERLI